MVARTEAVERGVEHAHGARVVRLLQRELKQRPERGRGALRGRHVGQRAEHVQRRLAPALRRRRRVRALHARPALLAQDTEAVHLPNEDSLPLFSQTDTRIIRSGKYD